MYWMQRPIKYCRRCISIAIRVKIFSATKRINNSSILPHRLLHKQVFLFIMKHIVPECCLQHLLPKNLYRKTPALKITFDVSHWCNVSESLLQDQPANVALAIERAEHIHARIGHAEGPQVNDPRAPEWEAAVKAHFAWWDKIVERKKQKGELLTILTEFGPPDYMPTMAYTRQPLADQWAINVYMMQLLRKRYL